MSECKYCSGFDIYEPKLKYIEMYETMCIDGNKKYYLDIERPDGFIPEEWRNKRLEINYCPICGRKLKMSNEYHIEINKDKDNPGLMFRDEYGLHSITDYDSVSPNPEKALLATHTIIENELSEIKTGKYKSTSYSFKEYEIAKNVISEIICNIKKHDERNLS